MKRKIWKREGKFAHHPFDESSIALAHINQAVILALRNTYRMGTRLGCGLKNQIRFRKVEIEVSEIGCGLKTRYGFKKRILSFQKLIRLKLSFPACHMGSRLAKCSRRTVTIWTFG